MTRRDSAPSPPSARRVPKATRNRSPDKCPIRNARSSTINCNVLAMPAACRYQIVTKQAGRCRYAGNENSRKSLDLQLFLRGEADGIRTRNPRIDSTVDAI